MKCRSSLTKLTSGNNTAEEIWKNIKQLEK